MATVTLKDLRRTDQRATVEPGPVWITSGWFTYEQAALGALLFSFPATKFGGIVAIQGCVVEIATAFAGGTPSIDIGEGTVSVDKVYDGDDITIVDADEYVPSADITEGTVANYPALTGDSVALWAAGQMKIITPADATVPVIYATLSASLTAGKGRVHVLMSEIPVA